VNGTVNTCGHGDQGKGWVDGGLCVEDGTTVINGNGTINLKSKGNLLNIGERRKLTLDGVTLVGLADNDSPFVHINNGGEFIMKSGKITGNICPNGPGTAVFGWDGVFTMEGGEISGNSATDEVGGVSLMNGSMFTLKGGTISDNSGKWGGGVSVLEGSTFIMEGGAIMGNFNDYDGGGVFVYKSGIFIMKGGMISGNRANRGGGVSVVESTFTMEGGVISGNSAVRLGGGIEIRQKASFTLISGTIYGSSTKDGNANTSTNGAALSVDTAAAIVVLGTGGTYTKRRRFPERRQ
jgi:hypothetical protein